MLLLRREVRRCGIPISLRLFHSLLWSTVKGFSIINKAEIFSGPPCFLYNPMNTGNLTFSSSAFSKFSMYIWMLLVHILLRPRLKDFEHYLANMWKEHNCMVVWIFFDIAFIWDLNDFLVLWLLLSFPNLLTYWMQHFNTIIF